MRAVKKQVVPRPPRAEEARSNGLSRVELELPDGRYLLSYERARSKPNA